MADILHDVMALVNDRFPAYGRGIISPENMLATRTASCFGRAAAIGAGVAVEGIDPDSLGWLISLSHGLEYKPGVYWLGHAFLTVAGEHDADTRLVDATNQAALRDLTTVSWRPSDISRRPFTDYVVLDEVTQGESGFGQCVPNAATCPGYARAWTLRSFFAWYNLEEGILQYQAAHPYFNAGPSLELSDYINFYRQSIQSTAH